MEMNVEKVLATILAVDAKTIPAISSAEFFSAGKLKVDELLVEYRDYEEKVKALISAVKPVELTTTDISSSAVKLLACNTPVKEMPLFSIVTKLRYMEGIIKTYTSNKDVQDKFEPEALGEFWDI